MREITKGALGVLAIAHPISFSKEQVESLPLMFGDEGAEYFENMRPPFASVFFDLDNALVHQNDHRIPGALLGRSQGRPMIVPFGEMGGLIVPLGLVEPTRPQYRVTFADGDMDAETKHYYCDACVDSAATTLACLYLLESANVDLEEASLKPRQRQRELKKGRRIALTIQVRQPKTKPVGRNGKANYSHRFEVRGHYMHFPESTKIGGADPDKLSFVPGRGFVRKVWCPPHVKGPVDKPLVPKVRVISNASQPPVPSAN